ncbi:MAG: response regulator [Bacteroides sp.]|nr:response regulator [Bacteroides sp.]
MKIVELLLYRVVCLLLFFLFCSSTSFCAGHYFYKQLTLDAGLPTTLSCIFADTRGFIWTGTQAGLGRFDGHEYKRYVHRQGDAASLPGNQIFQIMEDRHRNLWILTDGGVTFYDYYSNLFTTLTDEQGNPCMVYSVCQWHENVLFGGKECIYRYDEDTHRLKKLYRLEHAEGFSIIRMAAISSDILLCASRWKGVLAVDMNTGCSTPMFADCGKEIVELFVDSRKRIWVAPYNQGVYCYSSDGRLLASYTTRNSELGSDIVICIAEREGQIWLGTDGEGIDILEPEQRRFTHLRHVLGEKLYSLPTNSINCLHCDPYGNVWTGGVYNGLISVRLATMRTYTDVPWNSHWGLSHSIVLCLHPETPDRIWIGTDGGGLSCFNPETKRFTHYPTTRKDKITSICEFAPNKLLLSLFADELFVFDTRTGVKTPFKVIDEKTSKIISRSGYSVYLYRNTPHTILILSDHVYVYDLEKRSFSVAQEEKENLVSWGTLQSVCHDEDHTYLFDIERIYVLDHRTLSLKELFASGDDMQINAVVRDGQGDFWIGSNQGLSRYSPHDGKLEPVSTNLFIAVSSLVFGPGGELWIGAENRLFTYLPVENRFILFGESDGVISNEYLPRPKLVTENNDIYIGGVRGLLHISDKWNTKLTYSPELQLSGIILNGQSVNRRMEASEVLSVPCNSNITIRLMTKEEDIFRQKLYRYRIVGPNSHYMESYNAELEMRALRPGNYRIMASCMAKDGSWIPERVMLRLKVLPPWYQTWWAIGGCCMLVCAFAVGSFRLLLKSKDRKMKWAMKEHEQQLYEEKVRFLINVSHELRTPLTLIYASLHRMLKVLSPENEQYRSLAIIYRQSKRMKVLIDTVLDVRKMEVGEVRMHMQPCNLNEWIKHISQDFADEGKAVQVDFVYHLDLRIGMVDLDKDKCEIVLNNLLINALKQSPQHSTITITSELLDESDAVQVSVSDQGGGLRQVDMKKLFTRFYQGNSGKQGTGIGLSYSKILVEQHGGSMGAHNNDGRGATFFFRLPLKQEQDEVACKAGAYLNELMEDEENESMPEQAGFDLSAYSILVVDDHPDMISFLKESLGGYFKRVFTALDGVEALRLLKTNMPDIVVSDVMMPRMNGYRLCAEIKKDVNISHIPVILLTARHNEQSQQDGYKNGADGYLMKPFDIDTLVALLRNRLKDRDAVCRRYMAVGSLPVPEEVTFSRADESFLFRLNKIVEENQANTLLDIAFICKEMGMSRASLYNKLKALTGMGTNEYVNKFRMEKAVQLINNTDLPFADIAEKVGFATSSYFSTAFKQYMGETPTQYKKRIKQKQEDASDSHPHAIPDLAASSDSLSVRE